MDRVEEFILSGCRGRGYGGCMGLDCSKYFVIDVKSEDVLTEIPDFYINIFYRQYPIGYNPISFNLGTSTIPVARRLVRGALSDFMRSPNYGRFNGVIMGNNRRYYGAPGIIFDQDWNILMAMTTTIRFVKETTASTIIRYVFHNCRVSPLVFQNQDGIIEKTIIKKIIPYCCTHTNSTYDYLLLPSSAFDFRDSPIRVLIEDINKYFLRDTVPPTISECTPEAISDILKNNVESILA